MLVVMQKNANSPLDAILAGSAGCSHFVDFGHLADPGRSVNYRVPHIWGGGHLSRFYIGIIHIMRHNSSKNA